MQAKKPQPHLLVQRFYCICIGLMDCDMGQNLFFYQFKYFWNRETTRLPKKALWDSSWSEISLKKKKHQDGKPERSSFRMTISGFLNVIVWNFLALIGWYKAGLRFGPHGYSPGDI